MKLNLPTVIIAITLKCNGVQKLQNYVTQAKEVTQNLKIVYIDKCINGMI